MLKSTLTIKQISTEETIDVRQPVLRAGRPRKDCYFQGDDLSTTVHFGVYDKNKLAGVATFLEQNHHDMEGTHLQLRGMAVLDEFKGKGYGKLLLDEGEKLAIQKQKQIVWCNARLIAKPFYEKFGYKIFGKSFEIPIIGTHFVMYKEISNTSYSC
jgi:GNAT superfamily N-acetyltransferase